MKRFLSVLAFTLAFASSYSQANTQLSNLTSPTAVNQHLLPGTNNARDLGSATRSWRNVYTTGRYFINRALFIHNRGTANTFVGDSAGRAIITSGANNTGIGYRALFSDTIGGYNTAVGSTALYYNADGVANTAIGSSALNYNTSGDVNTAIGYSALFYNTTGSGNTAVGDALAYNQTGSENSAVGNGALFNTRGSENTAMGENALYLNQASYNTAFGSWALCNSQYSLYNTAIGYRSGDSYHNGYNNVFVGANTDVNGSDYYNVIVIGQGTIGTASSQVTIGNSATNSYRAYAGWSNISDGRYKKNMKDNVPGLSFITKLRPITYTLDATALDAFLNKGRSKDALPTGDAQAIMQKALKEKEAIIQTGFVAQDVEKAAKEVNYKFSGVDAPKNANDVYGLRYSDFVVPLVKAVQELDSANKQLKANVVTLQEQNKELETRLQKVEALLNINSNTSALNAASLEQNTPNPVSGTTTIRYHFPNSTTSAALNITNVKGQVVKTMQLASGSSQVNLNTSMLASGTYNYTLILGGTPVDTKRLVVAR